MARRHGTPLCGRQSRVAVAQREVKRKDRAAPEGGAESVDVIWDEARDHLFPWGRKFAKRSRAVQALTMAFALAVTVAWILGILGHLRLPVVIGWWVAWSAFELMVRVRCQPWFRRGPLLRRLRRPASAGEIIFYVTSKNILIGALLSLLMIAIDRPPAA